MGLCMCTCACVCVHACVCVWECLCVCVCVCVGNISVIEMALHFRTLHCLLRSSPNTTLAPFRMGKASVDHVIQSLIMLWTELASSKRPTCRRDKNKNVKFSIGVLKRRRMYISLFFFVTNSVLFLLNISSWFSISPCKRCCCVFYQWTEWPDARGAYKHHPRLNNNDAAGQHGDTEWGYVHAS